MQKLEYIHDNPVRAGLVKEQEGYCYSSAKFYCDGIDEFNFLTRYWGIDLGGVIHGCSKPRPWQVGVVCRGKVPLQL